MSKIIAIANQKGGVGKTTTTFNLGVGLTELGKKVLLIDLDGQSDLSRYIGYEKDNKPTICDLISLVIKEETILPFSSEPFDDETRKNMEQVQDLIRSAVRINENENLSYIPSTAALIGAESVLKEVQCRERVLSIIVSYLKNDYDYILLDCPPQLGNLCINGLTASDEILVPVQAETFSLDGLVRLLNTFKKVQSLSNPELKINGFLLTMTQDNTNMTKAVTDALIDRFGSLVYENRISRSTIAPESAAAQKSLLSYTNNKKLKKLGEQYREAAKEFLKRESL